MRTNPIFATAFIATIAAVTSAQAGGFSRGTADTDILYEDGNFNMRTGVTIVAPRREFTAHGNPALIGTNYTDTYIVPSYAIKLDLFQNLSCAGTVSQPYGGAVSYAAPTLSGKLSEEFTIYEFGATCAAHFNAGPGMVYLIGGIFQEQFDYERVNFVAPGLSNAVLGLSGTDVGYRFGVGYAIPDIALRAQLMYRSATEYGATGTLTLPGAALMLPVASVALPATGTGNLPQSLELKVQSGIAPGWLAFGSVKWTDWSVTTQLIVNAPAAGITQTNDYFWKDGWTVTAGIGHAFTDNISGALSITWDSGVATGWDLSSDSWTLAAGASVKDQWGGELRAGVGISYLSSAAETMYALNSAVDSGWAFAFSGSYGIKW